MGNAPLPEVVGVVLGHLDEGALAGVRLSSSVPRIVSGLAKWVLALVGPRPKRSL
jgi:hypothetical protein